MDETFLSSFVIAMSKPVKNKNDKYILRKTKDICNNAALEYALVTNNKLLYTIFQGYSLDQKLIHDFIIKNWKNDHYLFNRMDKMVKDATPLDQISEVCKFLRMLYFQELVSKNEDVTNLQNTIELFYKVYTIENNTIKNKKTRYEC